MFCIQCGAEMADDSRFCPKCGHSVEQSRQADDQQSAPNRTTNNPTESAARNSFSNTMGRGQTYNAASLNAIDVGVIVLLAILVIRVFVLGVTRFADNVDAFEWTDGVMELVGIVLHWGVVAFFAGLCLGCIQVLMKTTNRGPVLLLSGGILFVSSIILKVGFLILVVADEWDFENDLSIILYRIFGTYDALVPFVVFVAVVLVICGFVRGSIAQKNH